MSGILTSSPGPLGLAALDESLAKMKGLLHPEHFLFTKSAKRAFEDHNKRKNYKMAHAYGTSCLDSYRKYKISVWPSLAQLLLKLGRLELFNMSSVSLSPSANNNNNQMPPHKMAKDHFAEACEIIRVTHGPDPVSYTHLTLPTIYSV